MVVNIAGQGASDPLDIRILFVFVYSFFLSVLLMQDHDFVEKLLDCWRFFVFA